MITVKTGNYTRKDKELLHKVLSEGLQESSQKCNGECDRCEMKTVCADVNRVLHYLDKVLTEGEV